MKNEITANEAKVFNTPEAMAIITSEARATIAAKFSTDVMTVSLAIDAQNENVINMMRKLVTEGVKQVASMA